MFLRIIIVGILWGIVFTEGIRIIMLCNWHFDIFWPDHWRQAKELWQAGWVVRAPKEWAFVIILATFFPMLITGWWTLSLVAWERIIFKIIMLPVTIYRYFIKKPINVITTNNKYGVVKRKSYKQIRPTGIVGSIRSPISDYSDSARPAATVNTTAYVPTAGVAAAAATVGSAYTAPKPVAKKTDVSATIDHALFKFDDDDDDFDLDIDSFEKADITKKRKDDDAKASVKAARRDDDDDFGYFDDDEEEMPAAKHNDRRKNNHFDEDDEGRGRNKSGKGERKERDRADKNNKGDKRGAKGGRDEAGESAKRDNAGAGNQRGPVYDALQQKNYDIISDVAVKSTVVDFVGVSENRICLCLVDKENGDWLADEELFNGEEPLWFSESSHRISPVRKLKVARDEIEAKLAEEGFDLSISAYVVVQMANIINADDMFDIWDDMNISVTRINRGAPKEIQLFSKSLSESENSMPRKELDRLRKVLKSLK